MAKTFFVFPAGGDEGKIQPVGLPYKGVIFAARSNGSDNIPGLQIKNSLLYAFRRAVAPEADSPKVFATALPAAPQACPSPGIMRPGMIDTFRSLCETMHITNKEGFE
ncbi:MAG: hypothetical protein FWC45_02775 [Treponema sp.]|nr:hypothetical protein [Treponema sp.]